MNKPVIDKDQEGPSLDDVIGAMERLMLDGVTIISPEPVTLEQAFAAFDSALESMGLTTEAAGDYQSSFNAKFAQVRQIFEGQPPAAAHAGEVNAQGLPVHTPAQ